MFLFNKLPDIVKYGIIRYVVNGSFHLKERQAVLSTCSEWRELAIPIIFKVVVLCYQNSKAYIDIPSLFAPFTSDILLGSGRPILPVPSLSFAILAGATGHVRVLIINLDASQQCIEMLATLPVSLGIGQYSWSSVSSLYFLETKLSFTVDEVDRFGYGDRLKSCLYNNQDIPNVLAEGIPNVKYLSFNILNFSNACHLFANGMFDKYSHQLRVVDSTIPLKYLNPKIGIQITDLRLQYDNSVKELLSALNTDILRKLVIIEAPLDFSWSDLSETADGVVSFPVLASLELLFSYPVAGSISADMTIQTTTVLFPKLQRLTLKYFPETTFLFRNAQFSNNLKEILVYASLVGLSQLCPSINVERLTDILIYVEDNVNQDIFYETTNFFFNRKSSYRCSSLNVGRLHFSIVPELTNWQVLDMVSFNTIHYVLLIALISQFNTIKTLSVDYVSLEHILPNGDEFDPLGYVQNVSTASISSSLGRLTIQKIVPNMPSTIRTECFKHLVKRLPALRYFYSDDCNIKI